MTRHTLAAYVFLAVLAGSIGYGVVEILWR